MLRTFADGRLFGSLTGRRPPAILAMHGWGRDHHDFDAVLRPADGSPPLDALALDLPGFGATPPPTEAWGAADYAACISAVLDEMADAVVVLGHSFGGKVAVHLAARWPERVAALVLTGVPLLRVAAPPRPAPAYRLVRSLHRVGLVGDGRLEAARRRHGSADYGAAQGIMRQVHVRSVGETYEEQLDALACPVTMVWGADDTTVPLAVAEMAIDRLRQRAAGTRAGGEPDPGRRLELVVCPGAGHLLPLTAPGPLRAAVESRLAPRQVSGLRPRSGPATGPRSGPDMRLRPDPGTRPYPDPGTTRPHPESRTP